MPQRTRCSPIVSLKASGLTSGKNFGKRPGTTPYQLLTKMLSTRMSLKVPVVSCAIRLYPGGQGPIVSFENFVKGEMQKAATDAAMEYETASQTIETLPTPETLKARIDATGIPQDEVHQPGDGILYSIAGSERSTAGIDSEEAIPVLSSNRSGSKRQMLIRRASVNSQQNMTKMLKATTERRSRKS